MNIISLLPYFWQNHIIILHYFIHKTYRVQQQNIFNNKKRAPTMRSRHVKGYPFSAIDNYESQDYFSGWQPMGTPDAEDTFKQLRCNLNKYQRKYNETKSKQTNYYKNLMRQNTEKQVGVDDRENCCKLPFIAYSTPLKRIFTNKQPFLIKNKNILKEAMNHYQQHQQNHEENQIKNRTKLHKISYIVKGTNNKDQDRRNRLNPDFQLNFCKMNKQNCGETSQRKIKSRKKQEKMPRKQSQRKELIQYDFSDSKLLSREFLFEKKNMSRAIKDQRENQ